MGKPLTVEDFDTNVVRPDEHPSVPFWRASFVVMIGIVATSLAQEKVLARIPLRNLLKNDLHLDRSGMAAFCL